MNKDDAKRKLHELIESIEDEETLNMLYEDAVEYQTSGTKQDEELTKEQWASIQKGIAQIESGDFFTHEEVLQKVKEWRSTK